MESIQNILNSIKTSHKLSPDDRIGCFDMMGKSTVWIKISLAFYPGPALPPRADGSPIAKTHFSFE